MNILITTSTFPRWTNDNTRLFIFNLAKNLTNYHHDINIVILAPHYKEAKKYEVIEGIKIYRFKYFFNKLQTLCYGSGILPNLKRNKINYILLPFFLIAEFLALKKISKKEKIDIIHANWLIPQGLIAVIYKKIFNNTCKIICTIHGSDINSLTGPFLNTIKQTTIKHTNKIITVSEDLRRKIKSPNKAVTIPQGIDLKKFRKLPPDQDLLKKYNISSPCLLFVGRLVPIKGMEYLIKAMPLIIKENPKVKLLIIGDGPEINKLQKLSKQLKIDNNIKFLGNIKNNELPKYYNLANILIGPSIEEGLGVVFLEAMACHTPIIATNIGGIKDIVKHKHTGILIPAKNSTAIADEVIKLLNNKNQQEKLISSGKEFIKNFTWKNIANEHYKQYRNIINNTLK